MLSYEYSGKVCKKCEVFKVYDGFYKSKQNKDGYYGECIDCRKDYLKKNSEKIRKRNKEYKENNKESIQKWRKSYRENNSEYIKVYMRKYQKGNEKYKKNKAKYLSSDKGKALCVIARHKRRANKVKNGGTYTLAQWKVCLNYFNNECAYTGNVLAKETLHVDHIKPLSKGGTSYIWNLCPSVASANLSKYNSELEEWYKKQEYFTEERLERIYKWQSYSNKKFNKKTF